MTTDVQVKNYFQQADKNNDNAYISTGTNKIDTIVEATAGGGVSINGKVFKTGGDTGHVQSYGIQDVTITTTGTFTKTRVAQGDIRLRKTAAANTSIIAIDLLTPYNTTAANGAKLTSIDVIFANATANLTTHTATLQRVTYADVSAPVVASVPVTGTLATAFNANPQLDVLTVTTPTFENVADSKLVLEITAIDAGSSVYDFIGVVAHWTRF